MAEIQKLLDVIKESSNLHQSLRSDSVNLGFQKLYSILNHALEHVGDGKLRFQCWQHSQIRAIVSVMQAVALATRSLSLELVEPIVVATVQLSIDFATSCLERTEFTWDDTSLQNDLLQLLETTLTDKASKVFDVSLLNSSNVEDLMPQDIVLMSGASFASHAACNITASCLREGKASNLFLIALASEYVPADIEIDKMSSLSAGQNSDSAMSLFRHWAVVHVGCIHRLIQLSKVLAEISVDSDEMTITKRLSFSVRVLKLLGTMAKETPFIEDNEALLRAVALWTEAVPNLFAHPVDCISTQTAAECSIESAGLLMLEDFLLLVKIMFGSTTLFQNVQACIVASIFDKIDPIKWEYNKTVTPIKTPIAFSPRLVVYLLKLLDDVQRQKYQIIDGKESAFSSRGKDVNPLVESLSCHVHSEKVYLMKQYTVEELLKIIFLSSKRWLDNVIHLVFLFHAEGVRLTPKLDKSFSSCVKSGGSSEIESALCHEEEALFGDLFSEGGRSIGSVDGSVSPSSVDISSSYGNMSIRAATELLNFLKCVIFAPDNRSSIYANSCKQFGEFHIDTLLSIINCRSCHCDYKAGTSVELTQEQRKARHLHELCFQLMHNMVIYRVLADSLEEYLVMKILDADGGSFVYKDRALTLAAQVLICRTGSSGDELATKIFKGYVNFIINKAGDVISNCPNMREVIGSLPSALHVEIILLAFHLSSQIGKAKLANLVLSSLRTVDLTGTVLSHQQLSCWAILVSRLVIVFRHMIFHPSTCPSQLLLDLRSKLREAQIVGLHPFKTDPTIHSSWVLTVHSLMGAWLKEDPLIATLLDHLIDFVNFPASLSREDLDIQCLSLSWDDVCACYLQIIGLWRGKQAETVEDMMLERYMFSLCWDIPTDNSHILVQRWVDSNAVDTTSVEQCFHVSHLLVGQFEDLKKQVNIPEIILSLLRHIHDSYISLDINDLGWDFFRRGMCFSLVLSLLDTEFPLFSMKKEGASTGHDLVEEISWAKGYCNLAAGQVLPFLKLFSSLLQKCLQVYQRTLSHNFFDSQSQSDELTPILLLKSTGFEKQDELIKKFCYDPCYLKSFHDILQKMDATTNKTASGVLPKVCWESMLHGLPSYNRIPSGAVFSCILLIRRIICILEQLLKTTGFKAALLETESVGQLLDSVMTVKSDEVFETVHVKCKAICSSLTASFEGLDYSVIYLVKQTEILLRVINGRKMKENSIIDWIVTRAIDTIDALRKDPSLSVTFRFYTCEDHCEKVKELFGLQHSDLMFLIDSMDICSSETVDVKALTLFSDIVGEELSLDLKRMLKKKFLEMDLLVLSKWLEKRLLGLSVEASDGNIIMRGSSQSLRETAMNFVMCLVSPLSELYSQELQHHFFKAAMHSFDTAFLMCDILAAKSYFHFISQLSKSESSAELLLRKTVSLLDKLVGNEKLLQGLKFLLSFLGSILSDYGCDTGHNEKFSFKSILSSSISTGSVVPRPANKSSDSLVFSASERGGSASIECDTMSVDEDEDDGTSDGEVASLDKDVEDDALIERALASKVCTFTSSGSNFMEQHWYFCYTCDLTLTKGCCSVCAKVCHRGHRVVYSRSSRFFCDCGAGGVRGSNCQCLKPRKFVGANSAVLQSGGSVQPPFSLTEDGRQLLDSDSDLEENLSIDVENPVKFCIPKELQSRLLRLLEELNVEDQVIKLCFSVMPSVVRRRESNLTQENKITLDEDKVLSYGVELLQLKKSYKSGSMDLKMKAEYSNAKEVKSLIASGSLVKSLLSVSVRDRLAVGEGDRVAIFDVGQLIEQATVAPVTADKANVKALSKNLVRFEIMQILFNPLVESYLAVAGYEDCQVLTVSSRGEVTDRLPIELALQGAYVRHVEWVPGSQVQLIVVANSFVKIFDLSQDNISPLHYFTLPDDMIADASVIVSSQGRMFLLVLSEGGNLFRHEFNLDGDVGVKQLKEIIPVRDRKVLVQGSSLYFSMAYKILFVSYQDGTSLIGHLNSDATALTEISYIYENEDEKLRPAALHRWKELVGASGLFVCFSSIKCTSLAIAVRGQELIAQNVRHSVGSSSSLVGITAYKPLSKDKIHCLVLHDDGSLQIYSHVPVGVDAGLSESSDKVKKLGPRILENDTYAGANPDFPVDFFEKTFCITADLKLGGDAVRNCDSEGVKQNLASEDGFLESHSPSGFKITVSNSNPDVVMVGFRVHVGNTSSNNIPSSITIFHRVIKLDEGMRSWYDIPFTIGESLLADEEFTISVGPTYNGSSLPRIDSLEVYGRAKDEFGWKEKMDAVLDMESRMPGCDSWVVGSGKKYHSMQSAPIQEQVVAAGLKFLSTFYLLSRISIGCNAEEVLSEMSKLKCKALLETIFESDKEPILQAAANCVLQSIFPKKELYKQVKDTLRLLGVVKTTSVISSRLGIGGSVGQWIVEEFTAQMRAVSKIALQRRSNLATFLEVNGSEVVDGLMQVLWGILDVEQLDTQTTNNIVISSVELIYCYAECLALNGKEGEGRSVAPAVSMLKRLLLSPNEAIQTSSSLAMSSRLLQVPFPKQTFTADDGENIASTLLPADTPGAASQMMMEDDGTPSVQYCCDGCNTVPIPRRRWHCTVCPDFDLCDACYDLFGAGRLPSQQHPRDHPMTAIPVEAEIVGADNSTADITDSNLLEIPTDPKSRSSATSIHVLETNEPEEYSVSIVDPISISASRRAVNSLLLAELLEQLKGWMRTISGVRAIPVMQFFYRLSSAVGGPLVHNSKSDRLNLEGLVRWLLDEININQPFIPRPRSSFGEVTILIFMFFTLMLRNWHQPGNDGSAPKSNGISDPQERSLTLTLASPPSMGDQVKIEFASQLLQACTALRQQPFVNYLMSILQQLMHVFKSSSVAIETGNGNNSGVGCGMLLTIRRELPAGNFSPFFSDSYVKAHRMDIFVDYYRLLLENVFRLVYSLVRPEKQDKGGDQDKFCKSSSFKDLKLDGYQDVLCSYINNPHTTFIRRYARRLFLHICGSKTQYYCIRDFWQLTNEFKRLQKHVNKSGGFQNSASYERSIKIVKCLSAMTEIAAARPRNWQKYCLKHGDILPYLLDGVFYFGEESVIQTLKLLNLGFYTGKDSMNSVQKSETGDVGMNSNKLTTQKKKKGEDGTETGSEKSNMDMESVVSIFLDKGGDVLVQFVDCFLLEWNTSSVRMEAKSILYGLWHHGKQSFKENLLISLLQKVNSLPAYGQNITEYTELVCLLLGKGSDNTTRRHGTEIVNNCLTADVVTCIFETLHSQNELLANHHNSRIYNTLSGLVEFDGYYLESEPCVACSSPEVPYSKMKLESLKSETKFTDNRILVKCTGSYTIQTVTMNVHDARKSKSVKVLNLYYNNRPVADLSELKNNWSLWKRAKSCVLVFNQTELKVDFPIPITACNFMIELDSFYENLQALSLEPLQCPRCSRPVTDKHGICSNCRENAYQCRQCRNINYENLDSFLCNECGYSKYGRFEFNFMAKPSFTFDSMENDDDMKRGLAAIESESENAHRRYQQLLGFKKPLLKILSSIGENEMDSLQKDSVQQMMVSVPGPSCKVNRKIALLGVLYGEKCKAAFDSVSKSVQTLQGLRRVLMNYLHHKHQDNSSSFSKLSVPRKPYSCYGCAATFVTQCLEILQVLSKHPGSKKQLVSSGIVTELFENNIHQGPKTARIQARAALSAFSEGDLNAVSELNTLILKKVMYCMEHHRSLDISVAIREEMLLLSEVCSLADEFWESRLRLVFQLLFSAIKLGGKHPAITEHVILPCLRIVSAACTPPKPDVHEKEPGSEKPNIVSLAPEESNSKQSYSPGNLVSGSKSLQGSYEIHGDCTSTTQDMQLLSYSEWEKGATYVDFVRRQYKVSLSINGSVPKSRDQRCDFLALKYGLRWKRRACNIRKSDMSSFELGSWVSELVLSACSQSIRSEMCMLISLLCAHSSSRRFLLLNLLFSLLPATLSAGECAAEYFELLLKMMDAEEARLFLTVRGGLSTICNLISQEVKVLQSLEWSLHIDISQGFILHKLIEVLAKFLEVSNIRSRFMQHNLLFEVLEALIIIRGLIVQKTKLISDCNRLLKDLLDGLLLESMENKRQFIRACIRGLQIHGEEKRGRNTLFILEQLCNLICPSKPESVYLLVLNKAHTQEEFIRGSMTKNPYSSTEIGPLMRDVRNKICHQLDLLGLIEDDYGVELLVAGNIISLDLTIAQVYEQVWKKSDSHSSSTVAHSTMISSNQATSSRDGSPMIVTYRLQGLDGEATEPMIKEVEEDREESLDPEVEFAIAGAVREYNGLEIIMGMVQRLRDDLKSNQEQLIAVLNLLMLCCKIRENRITLLKLGALGLLLDTARRAFSVDAMELAECILLIVESLTLEANDSDNISIAQSGLTISSEESGTGEQAKKIILMFLERLCHTSGLKKSQKQQRNTEMVARILPYLTYGEPAAMEALIQHFEPFLKSWSEFDQLQKQHEDDPKNESIAQQATKQRSALENFVRVSESLKTSACGERLKDTMLEMGITLTAVKHLSVSFATTPDGGFSKSSAKWTAGLKLPSVPLILSMLRGLSMGHLSTQKCIDEGGILSLLHALEGVPGGNEIGARAENLLDTLSDMEGKGDGFLGDKIASLRHASKDEMRRLALRKRQQLLQGLGMHQELGSDGGDRIVVSRFFECLEDVEEEEDGWACMVCREGYSLRPTDLLGVYSYSKRVNLGSGNSGIGRGECVYTTVSHFNIIHFQCHQEAKRADAALKTPKKEWEGATLRNNETLCNSLFPVRGPSVPTTQYIRYVDQYWDNLSALGRADGSRLRLLTYDIVLMLARFATGASFSQDSKGGGKESNSRFLPFMIQMACHLLDQGGPSQRRTMSRSLSTYISHSTPDSKLSTSPLGTQPSSAGTEETVQFMMVNSLLSESYESWLKHRRTFLQRGIYHAYRQHIHGRSHTRSLSGPTPKYVLDSSTGSSSMGEGLLPIVQPMLVYTGLIEQLQRFLKLKKSGKSEGSSAGKVTEAGEEFEQWELVMRERLLNMVEMVGYSKELLSWLEDMNSATDLQEAFDVMGVLADVLSGGSKSCEDFVQAAIDSGKSS
uniref:Auxin transport protein BIG n=1 Tax=Kalanchoe fedtschenkoi TaxID=63787 RepID=A0A7N1A599_KALFE